MARCGFRREPTESCFERELVASRYRGGTLSDYASRLHYFDDWIDDNESRKRLANLTQALGGEPLTRSYFHISSRVLARADVSSEGCARSAHSRSRGDRIAAESDPAPGALPRPGSPRSGPARGRRPGGFRPRAVGPPHPPRGFHLPHGRQTETPSRVELPRPRGPHPGGRLELSAEAPRASWESSSRDPRAPEKTRKNAKAQRRQDAKKKNPESFFAPLRLCVFAFDSPKAYRARSPLRNARSRFRDTSSR